MDHNGVSDYGYGWKDAYGNDAHIGNSNHTPNNAYGYGGTFDYGYGVRNQHGYEIDPPSSSSSHSESSTSMGWTSPSISNMWGGDTSLHGKSSDDAFFVGGFSSGGVGVYSGQSGGGSLLPQGVVGGCCLLFAVCSLLGAVGNWQSATRARADVFKMHGIAAKRAVLAASWHDGWKQEEDHLARFAAHNGEKGKSGLFWGFGAGLVGLMMMRRGA